MHESLISALIVVLQRNRNIEKFEEDKDEFYKNKITLSKFYIEQLLPLASGYASSVTAGKEDLYAMKAENF